MIDLWRFIPLFHKAPAPLSFCNVGMPIDIEDQDSAWARRVEDISYYVTAVNKYGESPSCCVGSCIVLPGHAVLLPLAPREDDLSYRIYRTDSEHDTPFFLAELLNILPVSPFVFIDRNREHEEPECFVVRFGHVTEF